MADIESTRGFYVDVLGCKEGDSRETWIDFDFFGHQISAHVNKERPKPLLVGHVDNVIVPIPHFGAIISREEFEKLAVKLHEAGVEFLIPPTVRYEGKKREQMTMFFHDPSGNPIEFKSFTNPEHMYIQE